MTADEQPQDRGRNHSSPWHCPTDPGYRRLRYLGTADDHILGFIGPKAGAEEIKINLATFLQGGTRVLELNQSKTLITHARTGAARFLGYEITVQHSTRKSPTAAVSQRSVALRVPLDVIKAKCARTGATANPGTGPGCRTWTTTTSSGSTGRIPGLVNYYLLGRRRLAAATAALGHAETSHAENPGCAMRRTAI